MWMASTLYVELNIREKRERDNIKNVNKTVLWMYVALMENKMWL